MREPSSDDAPLDLFVSREGLVGDVMVGDPVGHSECEMRGFGSLGDGGVAAELPP